MFDPQVLVGEVIDGRYRLAALLSEAGAYGVVYAADELLSGEVVGQAALKLVRPKSDAERASVLREVRALSQFVHPNLVAYRAAGEVSSGLASGCIYIAMELAEEALTARITPPRTLSALEMKQLVGDVARGLEYLHSRGAVHRDIKPGNILYASGTWKLADMGLVRGVAGSREQASGIKGTVAYMSPEALRGQTGPGVDIWALGVVVQECLSGNLPWHATNESALVLEITKETPVVPEGMAEPYRRIVIGCFANEQQLRLTAPQVLSMLANPLESSVVDEDVQRISSQPNGETSPSTQQSNPSQAATEREYLRLAREAYVDGVITENEKLRLQDEADRLGINRDTKIRILHQARLEMEDIKSPDGTSTKSARNPSPGISRPFLLHQQRNYFTLLLIGFIRISRRLWWILPLIIVVCMSYYYIDIIKIKADTFIKSVQKSTISSKNFYTNKPNQKDSVKHGNREIEQIKSNSTSSAIAQPIQEPLEAEVAITFTDMLGQTTTFNYQYILEFQYILTVDGISQTIPETTWKDDKNRPSTITIGKYSLYIIPIDTPNKEMGKYRLEVHQGDRNVCYLMLTENGLEEITSGVSTPTYRAEKISNYSYKVMCKNSLFTKPQQIMSITTSVPYITTESLEIRNHLIKSSFPNAHLQIEYY